MLAEGAVRVLDDPTRIEPLLERATALVLEAAQRWKRFEGSYRDDITAVVVYLPETISTLGQNKADKSPRTSNT